MKVKSRETILIVSVLLIPLVVALTTTDTDVPLTTTRLSAPTTSTTESKTPTASSSTWSPSSTTDGQSTSTMPSSTLTESTSTSTSTTSTPTSIEWKDMDDKESQKLVNFVVAEIQKLKMEHKELDDCQELNLSSVLSGKKLNGKVTKYSVTLKVQPQMKTTDACLQQNSTLNNMHPEICEADVTEGDRGGTDEMTLLRSTCLQVEELQD